MHIFTFEFCGVGISKIINDYFWLIALIDNKWTSKHEMLTKARNVFLTISIVCAYIVWGSIVSLLAPFYPMEAEKKGATPSQVCHKESNVF